MQLCCTLLFTTVHPYSPMRPLLPILSFPWAFKGELNYIKLLLIKLLSRSSRVVTMVTVENNDEQ